MKLLAIAVCRLNSDFKRAMNLFELWDSQHLVSRICLSSDFDITASPENYITALINMSRAEYIQHGKSHRTRMLLNKARRRISVLKSIDLRNLHTAHALNNDIWMSSPKKKTVGDLLAKNQEAIDLVKSLPKRNRERTCLLAGGQLGKAYYGYYKGSTISFLSDFGEAIDSFTEVANNEPPLLAPFEAGVIEQIKSKSSIMKKNRRFNGLEEDDFLMYDLHLKDKNIAKVDTLSSAEWILCSLMNQKEYDHAYHFATEALISHAQLFSTQLFKRVSIIRGKCRPK